MNLHVRPFRTALDGRYVLVVTASSREKEAVRATLDKFVPAELGLRHKGCQAGLVHGQVVLHVTGESGGSKKLSAGRIVRTMLADPMLPKPALIVLCGICWGVPKFVQLQDVIVCDRIRSLNHQEVTEDGRRHLGLPLVSRLQIDDGLHTAIKDAVRPLGIGLARGTLASLETFLGKPDARDAVAAQYPDILGGEMEAYDFVPDCEEIPWAIIKGVSDFATKDLSKDLQTLAAEGAAQVLRIFLGELVAADYLQSKPESNAEASLREIIVGNSIVISVDETDAYGLNDFLNDDVGPKVEAKLDRYSSALELGPRFPSLFCDVLLEIAQNSLRHGGATRVEITFNEVSITILDDGSIFDVCTLVGERGGATAWRAIQEVFLSTGEIHLQQRLRKKSPGNIYTFRLSKTDRLLQDAMSRCRAEVIAKSVGAPMGRRPTFEFPPECKGIFFDGRQVRMSSRRVGIISGVTAAIDAGKIVFLGCSNGDEVADYTAWLAEMAGPQLRIFVMGPKPSPVWR